MYRRVELFEKPVFVHRAQAMCYAYIFALQNNMETIGIQMTYCNLETEQTKYFREEFSFEEIKKWFDDLMEEYGRHLCPKLPVAWVAVCFNGFLQQ